METAQTVALSWRPFAELRQRVVPLVEQAMVAGSEPASLRPDFDPVRQALAVWVQTWQLAERAAEVGAALSMYWHLEPDAAREFFVPRHIQSMIDPPRRIRRARRGLTTVAPPANWRSLLPRLSGQGCLLIREKADTTERLGALDSLQLLDFSMSEAAVSGEYWILLKMLGYDQQTEGTWVVCANRVEALRLDTGPALRFHTATGATYLARDRPHEYAWRYWLQHRVAYRSDFARLDRELEAEFISRIRAKSQKAG